MCELLSNNSLFVSQLYEDKSLALGARDLIFFRTDQQRVIAQQFTARADLFLKYIISNMFHLKFSAIEYFDIHMTISLLYYSLLFTYRSLSFYPYCSLRLERNGMCYGMLVCLTFVDLSHLILHVF